MFSHRALRHTTGLSPRSCLNARAFSSDSQFKHLIQEKRGSAVWITMNRGKVHNAFNEEVIAELHRAFRDVPCSATAVVLTGSGKSFSAGADVNWMAKMAGYSEEENRADSDQLFAMFAAIKECPVPTIARINGAALGGGAGLVAACDMAFCVDRAVMGFTEVNIGLIPAVISKFVMEKIGKNNCRRYFLTGERFSGPPAKDMGLVNESVATIEELDEVVQQVTDQLKSASPQAVRKAKVLIEEVSAFPSANASRAFVTEQIASIRVSPEGQEGLQAFLEKRTPAWVTDQAE